MAPNKICICNICNCGRHRCPVHNKTGLRLGDDKECKVTEYTSKYPAYDIDRVPSFKPQPQLIRDGGKLDDATTFKTDYIPHPLQEKYHHKPEAYMGPAGDFSDKTTYVVDYPGKQAEKTQSMRPRYDYSGGDVPFEGHPTYKDDYQAWQTEPTRPIKKDKMYAPSTVPMEGTTTNKIDYVPRDITKTKSCKPDNMAMVSSAPFDDLTNHKVDYIGHPLPEKFRRAQDQYRPSRDPFDDLTTVKKDYPGYNVPKVASFKPNNAGVRSDAPLDDATEFKDSYKSWDLPKHQQTKREAYVKPQGAMDSMTSHKKDYVPHQVQPARSMRPQNNASGNDAKFDDTTTFKTDYKPWEASHSIRGDPSRKEYQMPSAPFEGMPTYKAHYTEHALNPNKSYKPDNYIDANKAPFEGNSMYKTEYTPKQNELCPAVELPKHGYKFLETDRQGHQFYTK